MPKTDKATKRKAKLRARKRQMNAARIGVATRLSAALERLCAPVLPEYIDDSNGLDLIGRRIVYQMRFIPSSKRSMPIFPIIIPRFAQYPFP